MDVGDGHLLQVTKAAFQKQGDITGENSTNAPTSTVKEVDVIVKNEAIVHQAHFISEESTTSMGHEESSLPTSALEDEALQGVDDFLNSLL